MCTKEGYNLTDLKVMLADDERMILDGIKLLYDWKANGFEIIGDAMDGINAVNLALKERPDIILLDIMMPLLNGFEVIQKLENELPETKFIIISSYNEYKLLREAIKLQAFDYLLKPLHEEDLIVTMKRVREEIFDQRHLKKEREHENDDIPLYKQMSIYIEEHLSEKITLSVLSQRFNLNSDYISSYFKKKSGMNFSDYLNSRRIAEAKKLLNRTELSIGEISDRVGFSDYRYFNKVFRNYLKVSPSQYRIEHREK